MVFAPCPPDDTSFLTTRLWDKYMSRTWRNMKDRVRKFDGTDRIDPIQEKEILDQIRKFAKEAKSIDPNREFNSDQADNLILKHTVSATKGKWKKFPPEVVNSKERISD